MFTVTETPRFSIDVLSQTVKDLIQDPTRTFTQIEQLTDESFENASRILGDLVAGTTRFNPQNLLTQPDALAIAGLAVTALAYAKFGPAGAGAVALLALAAGCINESGITYEKRCYYADNDKDGYGTPVAEGEEETDEKCITVDKDTEDIAPDGYSRTDDDCDDGNALINPAANEVCDGIDNDCDGFVDDSDSNVVGASTWYADEDNDGYGNPDLSQEACSQPDGYVDNDDDCDDADPDVNPDTVWYLDADSDNYGISSDSLVSCEPPTGYAIQDGDCDDSDPALNPANPDNCGVPIPVMPADGTLLPPTRAFLHWEDHPWDGKTVSAYDVCYADTSMSGSCLSHTTSGDETTHQVVVIDPLAENENYTWKVRTLYTDGTTSAFSSLYTFITDDSVVGWWKFDEGSGTTAHDSANANDGTVVDFGGSPWSSSGIDGSLSCVGGIYVNLESVVSNLGFDISDDYATEVRFSTAGLTEDGTLISVIKSQNAAPGTGIRIIGSDSTSGYLEGTLYYYVTEGQASDPPESYGTGDEGIAVLYSGYDVLSDFTGQEFHNVVGAYNGVSLLGNLFVDGQFATSAGFNDDVDTPLYDFDQGDFDRASIGTYSSWDYQYYRYAGLIDEVVIYRLASSTSALSMLSEEAVKNSYCATEALWGVDPLPSVCQ